ESREAEALPVGEPATDASPWDNLTPEQRRRAMRAVKSRNTSPELALRRALRDRGVRGYRIDWANAPGKPDVAFPGRKVAVFIDGGFWHGRPDRVRPGRSEYWDTKIARNKARDARQDHELRRAGWRVLRLWDDEVLADPRAAAERVARMLRPFAVAEFFAGVGLARLGLEAAGGRVVWANDVEPVKRTIYEANFPVGEYVLGDVRGVRADSLPDVDLAWASFPCTDLSLAGERAGLAGAESGLVWEFLRVLEEMGDRRPGVVALENVSGFISSNGGRDVLQPSGAQLLGYTCGRVRRGRPLLRAAEQAALLPRGLGGRREPAPTAPEPTVGSHRSGSFRPAPVARLFEPPGLRMRALALPTPEPRNATLEHVVERLASDDPRWWPPETQARALAQMEPGHQARLTRLAASPTLVYAAGYRRTRKKGVRVEVRDDGVAGCLRTLRGGSSRQMLFECGAGRVRMRWLTARECARLMGAPDSFVFGEASDSKAMYALGDAVCVPVVEWLTGNCLWGLVR
ncbi:MAG: DNA mismatch endonuclease Vsr, partial [Chloroflexia bacterium]